MLSVVLDELRPLHRQWVALSSDSQRIVAHAGTLHELEDLLRAAGEDASEVGLQWIESDDASLVGSEPT